MRADNSRFIVQAARVRHDATVERAREALRRLDRSGEAISFLAVARAASVSRAWLYRDPPMRAEIERLRSAQRDTRAVTRVPAAQRASAESLQQRIEATHEEIRRLKDENRVLREQVARLFGERRVHGVSDRT